MKGMVQKIPSPPGISEPHLGRGGPAHREQVQGQQHLPAVGHGGGQELGRGGGVEAAGAEQVQLDQGGPAPAPGVAQEPRQQPGPPPVPPGGAGAAPAHAQALQAVQQHDQGRGEQGEAGQVEGARAGLGPVAGKQAASTVARSPTGRLRKKIQRQEPCWRMNPASTGPPMAPSSTGITM